MTMTDTASPRLAEVAAMVAEELDLDARFKELRDLNDALSASLQAPPEPDGPDRTLVGAARKQAGNWLDRVVLGRDRGGDVGAFRELQQEAKVASSNVIPFALFDSLGINAAASTVTSAGDQHNQQTTRDVVFGSLMTDSFGVQRPMVPVGVSSFPVVTAPTEGAEVATIGTAVSDETVTISGYELSPIPLTITATLGKDELSTFQGLADDVLRTLRNSIASGLDREALTSTNGLMSAGTDPTPTTTVATFASVLSAMASAVDGTYANDVMSICSLYHPQAYRLLWTLYRNQATDQSVAERLMSIQKGIMTTSLMPAVSSDDSEVLHIRDSNRFDLVQPLWNNGVEVIVDRFTLATANQLRISATLMHATRLLRSDNYTRSSMHLA